MSGQSSFTSNYLALQNLTVVDTDTLTLGGVEYTNLTPTNPNNLQPNPVNASVTLYTTGTGTLTLGNTSNTNPLTINQNITLPANKTITLDATGGKIICNTLEATTTASAVSLFGTGTLGSTISLGSLIGTLTINPNTTLNGNLILGSSKTITLNATGGKVLCNVYTGTNTASNLTLGESGDTGTLTIYKTIAGTLSVNNIQGSTTSSAITLFTLSSVSSPTITLGNVSGGTFTINPNTTLNGNLILGSSKTITLNATGGKVLSNVYTGTTTTSNLTLGESGDTGTLTIYKTIAGTLSVNDIQGSTTSSAITLFTNSSVSSPSITLGNASGGNFNINPNVVLGSSKNLTFTNGTLLVNTITGQATGSAISLFGTTTSTIGLGNVSGGFCTINPNTIMNGNLTLASSKTITLNGTGGKVLSDVYTGTTTSSSMTFGEFGDTSNITFYKNINMGAGRFITIQSDGTLYVNTITAVDSFVNAVLFSNHTGNINLGYNISSNPINLNCSTILASNKNLTLQGSGKITTPSILVSGLTASKLVLTDGSNNLISSSLTDSQLALLAFSNVFTGLTNTFNNTILCNTITGTTAGSAISLFGTTTAGISLGSGSSSGITINDTTTFNTGKDLLFSSTGRIRVDRIVGSTPLTSDINIGYTDPLYTAIIQLNQKVQVNRISASKMVLTDSNKQLVSSLYTDTDFVLKAGSSMSGTLNVNDIQGTTTSSSITLFTNSSVSSPTITLGNTSGGNITINPSIVLPANKTITLNATGGSILCPTYNSTSATQALLIGNNNTTANVTIGGALTIGAVQISNNFNVSPITFRTKSVMSTSIGSCWWNVALGSANNIFQSSTLSTFAMPPVSASTSPPSANWAVWETNVQGEGAFIAMNGDTTIICNPGDTYAFHWQDEDTMGSALGFKFDKDGVMSTTSDARAKTNIKAYNKNNVLNKLNKIEMIKYQRKRPEGITRPTADDKYSKVHTGYTAQQLLEIGLDEFVEQPTTSDGYMSVSYGNIQFLFNAGVQELIKENIQQQKQIEDLRSRLVKLEQMMLG